MCRRERLCASVRPDKMFAPVFSTHLTVPDKVTVIMTIKKPGALLLATVIVSCDYLPSAHGRHILHNPPLTRAHCHLISLSIICSSAGKKSSSPELSKLEAIGVRKKPLM